MLNFFNDNKLFIFVIMILIFCTVLLAIISQNAKIGLKHNWGCFHLFGYEDLHYFLAKASAYRRIFTFLFLKSSRDIYNVFCYIQLDKNERHECFFSFISYMRFFIITFSFSALHKFICGMLYKNGKQYFKKWGLYPKNRYEKWCGTMQSKRIYTHYFDGSLYRMRKFITCKKQHINRWFWLSRRRRLGTVKK